MDVRKKANLTRPRVESSEYIISVGSPAGVHQFAQSRSAIDDQRYGKLADLGLQTGAFLRRTMLIG